MEELFASFQPMDDVVNLLSDLRQAGLLWVADEIETAIRNGNTLSVSDQKSDKKNTYKAVPFDARGQLRLALRTIHCYTVEMHKTWDWTQSHLRQGLDEPNLQLSIVMPDGVTEMSVFDGGIEKHLAKLEELLDKALFDNERHN